MKICFAENTTIINHDQYIPLGRLTCEQLNGPGWGEYRQLEAQMDFYAPINDDTTVRQYLLWMETVRQNIDRMKEFLNRNQYYRINDEAENTFAAVEELLNDTRRQMEKKSSTVDEYILDIGFGFDIKELQRASDYVSSLYRTHTKAVRMFTRLADDIMIQNERYPQKRAAERLQAFGLERLQEGVWDLVKGTRTASSSAYVPDFDMVTLPDGSIQIAPVVSINNVAQLMYHEFMNMIMQGHTIRRCKNCGKFFVQYGERVVEYCDDIPEGETKPCSMIGSSRQFTASLREDPIKQTYIRVYKKYVARRRARAVTDTQFSTWSKEARKLRDRAYEAGMHEETFRIMLDDLMTDIIGGVHVSDKTNSKQKQLLTIDY